MNLKHNSKKFKEILLKLKKRILHRIFGFVEGYDNKI